MARPFTPPAQPRPKTGTRRTSSRKPSARADARLQAGGGDAGGRYGDDAVHVLRADLGSFDGCGGRFDEQALGAFQIDGVPVMPAMGDTYQSCGATMWRRAMPALSNTPDRRSNRALLPPNASRARTFATSCSMTCGGTAVASESKLQGRSHPFDSAHRSLRQWNSSYEPTRNTSRPLDAPRRMRLLAIGECRAAVDPTAVRRSGGGDLRFAVDHRLHSRHLESTRHRKARPYLGRGRRNGPKAAGRRRSPGPSVEPRRTARHRSLSRLSRTDKLGLSDLLRTIVERWKRACAGSRRAGPAGGGARTRRTDGAVARSRRRRGRTVRRDHRLRS